MVNSVPSSRLGYIDWLRGLACLLMFQTHCYDAWLGDSARDSKVYTWSQLGGTFPAPLFLFLAGMSFAIVIDKLRQKNFTANQIAKATIKRGAEILALGLLFRVQEYAIALGWAPWSDLFRVDILNTIGVSLIMLGVMCWLVLVVLKKCSPGRPRPGNTRSLIVTALITTVAISAMTPLLWTTWRPRFLPWELETYIDGVHNLGQPQSGLFPIFPWAAFAFAGLALGLLLTSPRAKKVGAYAFLALAAGGILLVFISKFIDSLGLKIYPLYDYWRTSPSFFIIRVGMLLLFTTAAYSLVPMGTGRMGLQSDDSAGKNLVARLLGAHRTGIRKIRDPPASQPECFGRDRGFAGDLRRDDGAVVVADETSRTLRSVGILAARGRAASAANFLRGLSQNTVTFLLTGVANESRIHAIY